MKVSFARAESLLRAAEPLRRKKGKVNIVTQRAVYTWKQEHVAEIAHVQWKITLTRSARVNCNSLCALHFSGLQLWWWRDHRPNRVLNRVNGLIENWIVKRIKKTEVWSKLCKERPTSLNWSVSTLLLHSTAAVEAFASIKLRIKRARD